MKKLTMQDIAVLAGVSRTTVSRFLNGGYVSQQNKAKIKQIIDQNEFLPNASAQSLKRDLNIIGVILPTVNSRTSAKLLKGIIDQATLRGFDVNIASCEHNQNKELELLRGFQNLRVRGIIALTTNSQLYTNRQKFFPHVVIITPEEINMSSIVYPDSKAIETIFSQLILPFIGTITGLCTVTADSIIERTVKITNHVHKLNLPIPYQEVITQNIAEYNIDIQLTKGTFYLCVTDQIAINLYSTAKQQNLIIGKDIFICGFGDYSISKLISPKLSSIHLPYYESGVKSVEKLLFPQQFELLHYMNFSLKKRESTL
ncbi:MAG: LacI family DNA-binding transcriptional regulator [Culicoidibacterales bacterium]